eukprot:5344698-Karenia_brevis.AAC.1
MKLGCIPSLGLLRLPIVSGILSPTYKTTMTSIVYRMTVCSSSAVKIIGKLVSGVPMCGEF